MTEKLVRNGPGFRIRAEGGQIRVAERHELQVLLAQKLVEEAQEVLAVIQNERGSHADTVAELADVTEAIRGLRRAANIRKDDIRAARRAKRLREGDFSERLVWMQDG
jgi:predicted house-cleaning noncanonical NTP pyrophosphatase (MazG superfamily)